MNALLLYDSIGKSFSQLTHTSIILCLLFTNTQQELSNTLQDESCSSLTTIPTYAPVQYSRTHPPIVPSSSRRHIAPINTVLPTPVAVVSPNTPSSYPTKWIPAPTRVMVSVPTIHWDVGSPPLP